MIPNREQATAILNEYVLTDALRKHAKSVESVMRHFADIYGEDVEYWGAVGLLHDVDYEKYPEEHCKKVFDLLLKQGVEEPFIRSIASHGYGICSDIEPTLKMEQVLYATDELTGLITACALMRPSKSVMDLELKSVRKKYKTANFAAGVDRSVIEKGAQMLSVSVDELITECILAMRKAAGEIGLGMQSE